MGNLPVALIGAGEIAQAYLDVIRSGATDIDIVAVVEPDAPRAAAAVAAAAKVDVLVVANVHQLLDRRDHLALGGVLICSPPITHVPVATAALEAGLSVLCEKPLAPNRPGLSMMVAAAEKSQQLLMVASKFRYVDDVTRAKELISSGELGDIVFFHNTFTSRVAMADRWNSKRDVAGGGVIIDLGTHSVDLARCLLGPIRYVMASQSRHLQNLAVEDTAQVCFRTDSNALGTIDLSWSVDAKSPWYVTVDGTRGSLRLGWQSSELNTGSGWTAFGKGFDQGIALAHQLKDFADAARSKRAPLTTLADAFASVAVIDAAYRSVDTAAWVRVSEPYGLPERTGVSQVPISV